jgi:hypothetical protein
MMNMKPIERKKLANGCRLTVWDLSRNIVPGRWQVKIRCETEVPVREEFFRGIEEDDPELLRTVHDWMGRAIIFSTEKERNFIDEAEKDRILNEMVNQACDAMLVYLGSPEFPAKMFKKRFLELKCKWQTEMHCRKVNLPAAEDDDGPADFSACFQD